ncbi:hypothetical protein A3A14_03935 [Candidatus Daviesbacteria bacterium RIFCSPLOWO2_01_FULL_43_38]|nr:MAG: hypothetical protein A2874_01665 [Candidatus Daviesbacteria bacterium RIFCSPHIGHO2_01_FULL_43_17]OGE63355.1 MAG: hypothetical protein A3A14_03935 [Candidatus Daviesbacteria bacterium RIFCSPLOWO2_01_FULL_43_38]
MLEGSRNTETALLEAPIMEVDSDGNGNDIGLQEEVVPENAWEKEIIGWAKGRKSLWKCIELRDRNFLDLCYLQDLDLGVVSRQLSHIFRVPSTQILGVVDASFSKIAQAWERDFEKKNTLLPVAKELAVDNQDGEDVDIEDPVKMYLHEIGGKPLLSAQQEREYGRIILEAQSVVDNSSSFTPREVAEAKKQMTEASHAFTEANLRLVVSVAKKYIGIGMEFLDLISEGNIGLIRAVEKYDYRKGFKFSTYATWWIRQAITRAVADKVRMIRVPVHMHETINKFNRAEKGLMQQLGREPTEEELAREIGITVKQVLGIIKAKEQPVSLDGPVGDEEDESTLGDFIPDRGPSVLDQAVEETLKADIRFALSTLAPRERRVLELRFGLGDGRPRTLEDIGREFALTRERIRQIENKAIRKLKHPSRSERLRGYLEWE